MVGTITHGVWQVREMAQRDYCFYSHLRRICLYIGDIEEVRKATLISISESYQAYGCLLYTSDAADDNRLV